MTRSALFTVALLAGAVAPAACAPEAPLAPTFPFEMPAFDSSPTPVDMSFLNPEAAGKHGFIRVKDGRFVDGTGKRIRFLGTNVTFQNAFPPKDAAPRVAARLRKLGMNVVRFHHMDNRSAPGGIWLPDQKGLDPEQLDRLDWFIYQLKEHGIYSNLNLHVSRNYPGLPEDASRSFNYGKVLDNFHRPFIDLQKEYARALLTHVNKYTGQPYTREPAIAAVEINNENTLLGANWNTLRALPEPFLADLTQQWRAWLKARYKNTAGLRKAWQVAEEPFGPELLTNGDFAGGTDRWELQHSAEAEATMEKAAEGPKAGQPALAIHTTKQGPLAWDFQLHQVGLTLEDGAPYTLTFQARGEPAQSISAQVRLHQEPWTNCGLDEKVVLTDEWQSFSFTFRARGTQPERVRVTMGLSNQLGRFWLANVSLRRGGLIGLAPDQSLEADNIPLAGSNAAPTAQRDFWAFLAETERAYVREMVDLLKKDLKVEAPVVDTQGSYGGIGGVYREAALCDYVDMHSYWQHPSFPGRPWDGNNWRIGNSSMVRDANGGTLSRLALHRVEGMPFTVSEYDHPAPSLYAAEMMPMLASFAAFQDWDGLYQFDYGDTHADEARISGYFTMRSHPGKVAFFPVAALLFRGGAVQPGKTLTSLELRTGQVVPQLVANGTDTAGVWRAAGAERTLPIQRRVAVRVGRGDGDLRLRNAPPEAAGGRQSETGEIQWQADPAETALYTVNSPAVRVAAGYLGGRTVALGDVKLTMAATPSNWASVAVAALDGKPVAQSRRLLLVAMGRVENTDWQWNEERNTLGRNWGKAPTRAEGIPLEVTIPGGVASCRALDGTGAEGAAVPVRAVAGASVVSVSPDQQTVWYLLTR